MVASFSGVNLANFAPPPFFFGLNSAKFSKWKKWKKKLWSRLTVEGGAGMEDEEEETRMDERASGTTTQVSSAVGTAWIGGQGCRLTTNRKIPPFSSLPYFPSLPFPSLLCRAGRKLAVAMCARRLQRLLTCKLSPHMQQQQQVDRTAAGAKIIAEPWSSS